MLSNTNDLWDPASIYIYIHTCNMLDTCTIMYIHTAYIHLYTYNFLKPWSKYSSTGFSIAKFLSAPIAAAHCFLKKASETLMERHEPHSSRAQETLHWCQYSNRLKAMQLIEGLWGLCHLNGGGGTEPCILTSMSRHARDISWGRSKFVANSGGLREYDDGLRGASRFHRCVLEILQFGWLAEWYLQQFRSTPDGGGLRPGYPFLPSEASEWRTVQSQSKGDLNNWIQVNFKWTNKHCNILLDNQRLLRSFSIRPLKLGL